VADDAASRLATARPWPGFLVGAVFGAVVPPVPLLALAEGAAALVMVAWLASIVGAGGE